MFLILLGLSFSYAFALKDITLNISYGVKSFTSREYTIVKKAKLKTPEGKKVLLKIKDPSEGVDVKLEITPTISSKNPNLIIVKVKGWRKVDEKYVKYIDDVGKAVKGGTLLLSERIDGSTDIQISITPYYY